MARIRSIKPSFFTSDDVSALPLRARLTWIGLWTQCDDAGRTKDHARLIKAAIWPLDNVSLADIEEDLNTLYSQGRIVRYEVDNQRFLEIVNWHDHQKIDHPSKSRIPPPGAGTLVEPSTNGARPLHEDSTNPRPGTSEMPEVIHRRTLTEDSANPRGRKGREGRGREGTRAREATAAEHAPSIPSPEPPFQCPDHQGMAKPPPCGACADARRVHEAWAVADRARISALPRCRIHRGQLEHTCSGCAADRKAQATTTEESP